ncbi:hypothetical protein PAPYR_914 [Paratrimastix pyriformis]|uniref:Uncharacterized protein n=1 Tax=Paratrimastix pyriformis TaxID=342808 RepID=A0ABQ8UV23_9EUKA|nr:hypothetical protein PAPYR_914 [Paratrimastix pyriformis]
MFLSFNEIGTFDTVRASLKLLQNPDLTTSKRFTLSKAELRQFFQQLDGAPLDADDEKFLLGLAGFTEGQLAGAEEGAMTLEKWRSFYDHYWESIAFDPSLVPSYEDALLANGSGAPLPELADEGDFEDLPRPDGNVLLFRQQTSNALIAAPSSLLDDRPRAAQTPRPATRQPPPSRGSTPTLASPSNHRASSPFLSKLLAVTTPRGRSPLDTPRSEGPSPSAPPRHCPPPLRLSAPGRPPLILSPHGAPPPLSARPDHGISPSASVPRLRHLPGASGSLATPHRPTMSPAIRGGRPDGLQQPPEIPLGPPRRMPIRPVTSLGLNRDSLRLSGFNPIVLFGRRCWAHQALLLLALLMDVPPLLSPIL